MATDLHGDFFAGHRPKDRPLASTDRRDYDSGYRLDFGLRLCEWNTKPTDHLPGYRLLPSICDCRRFILSERYDRLCLSIGCRIGIPSNITLDNSHQ
jgi:hypothetical protein